MDPVDMLAACDQWMGRGAELAQLIAAYADGCRESAPKVVDDVAWRTLDAVADDLEGIIKREWSPGL
jgi:hypothetical protein